MELEEMLKGRIGPQEKTESQTLDVSKGIKPGAQNVRGMFFPVASREIELISSPVGFSSSDGPDPRQPKFVPEPPVDVFKVLERRNNKVVTEQDQKRSRFVRFLLWLVRLIEGEPSETLVVEKTVVTLPDKVGVIPPPPSIKKPRIA